MTEFETASLILRGLVGTRQIGVVAIGIMVMRGMNRDYTRQFETQRRKAEQREKRADQRHAENMEALRAVIRGMDQQREALRAAVKGMEAVIERTAPKGRWSQRDSLPGLTGHTVLRAGLAV